MNKDLVLNVLIFSGFLFGLNLNKQIFALSNLLLRINLNKRCLNTTYLLLVYG